ncbi:hypothetical protein ACFLTT_02600 [Chloroflexota bacterium]
MIDTIARWVGYLSGLFALFSITGVLLVSFASPHSSSGWDFVITIVLCFIYLVSLIITYWSPFVAGVLLLSAGLAIGIPTMIINIWAGIFFGLFPMLAGISFITMGVISWVEVKRLPEHHI